MGFIVSRSGFEMTRGSKEVNTPGIFRKDNKINAGDAFSNAFAAALGSVEPKSEEEKQANKARRQQRRAMRKQKRSMRRASRGSGGKGRGKGKGKGLLIAGAIGGLVAAISILKGKKKNKNGNVGKKLPKYKTSQSYKTFSTKTSGLDWNPHAVSSKFNAQNINI